MDKRCQLIRPYVSNNIYEFPTLMQCAQKCCTDIENNFISEGLINVTSFTLKDIDTKEIFTFNMNIPLNKQPLNKSVQMNTDQGLLLMGDVENDKVNMLEQKINKLEDDMSKIKKILIMEKLRQRQQQQLNQDGCVIQ